MEQDKKVKLIIITATVVILAGIAGAIISALRKGKTVISVEEIMEQLGD